MKLKNKYFLLRHGETIHQIEKNNNIYFWPEDIPPAELTQKGREQIGKAAEELKGKGVDLVFSSNTLRTRQTAGIVVEKIGKKIILDERLRDTNWGIFQGKPKDEVYKLFYGVEGFIKKPPEGEGWSGCKKRMLDFFQEVEKKYQEKTILVISHGDPLWLLEGGTKRLTNEELIKYRQEKKIMKVGEIRKL